MEISLKKFMSNMKTQDRFSRGLIVSEHWETERHKDTTEIMVM